MQPYANKSGKSGIVAYEITADSIIVQFRDDWKYVYNTVTPGAVMLAQLKNLAQAGSGLNSYISSTVKKNFANKYL